ncbi:MAG: 16S rRNA (cytosine(967)-C(5))-methyltransferase RsmB [Tissierellia bacterium]|nr:16S rRNA (cytosine(967)-C(5))-methyltransferase RsmB [Tissierellia bacterium]MDD4779858.1 16S rRNA (cytosine(967)-C(5))-methyltransferase RsmB [Tissierellia bacterium]
MSNNYRNIAIDSLKKVLKDNAYSNIVINNDIKRIENKYEALYRKSVLGVIENIIYIDWIINQISKTKTNKMETEVLFTLRLAVYQLIFLENSYENIVVNESVQHIKEKVNDRASKFVNAILRNIIRNKEKIDTDLNKLPNVDYLSVKYSYPKWLVRKWISQFGKENIEEVLKTNNLQSFFEIRVNTLKTSRDELISILNNKGFKTFKSQLVDKCLIIENPREIDKTEEYKNGLFSIQSESSMLAGQVLNPRKNSFIIDLCAAPGGKSLNTAEMLEGSGNIISRDIYKNKMSLINKEIKRLNLTNIKTEVFDATVLDEKLVGKADYCIVDVPCTGLGIIMRKPEIKYNKNEEEIKSIIEIQQKILQNASKYLKSGGELVYSTCTTNKEENINVIKKFLENNENYIVVDITKETKNKFNTSKYGYIEIYPHMHNMDGFFIAKLKRL